MIEVVVIRRIAASPATVFSFFTNIQRWTAWQGVDGEIDPRPGGVFRVRMPGAQVATGQFLEVVPDRKLVFTWGWEGEGSPLPPGTSRVEIELAPHEGGTLLRLTHTGLATAELAEHHREGWERYLQRLTVRAEGGDPGSDTA